MLFRFLCLLMIGLLPVALQAQNPRLSQVWTTPMNVNPALSGRFDGMGRVGTMASWQKSSLPGNPDKEISIPHYNFYIDFKFGKYRHIGDEEQYSMKKKPAKQAPVEEAKDESGLARRNLGFWSGGVNYYHYGDNTNPIKADFVALDVARHFYVKSNIYYGVGFQTVFAHGNLDENRGTDYDREISGAGFRYPHGLIPQGGRVNTRDYVDFNLGGYYGMASELVSFELGLAMYHLFYPKNAIVDDDDESKQRHRLTAHSLLRLRLNDNWGMVQRNIYWEEGLYYRSRVLNGDSAHITAFYSGVEFYKTNPKTVYNLNFGMYTRTFKTFMPFVNVNLSPAINLRYSYEFPINSKKFTANSAKRSEFVFIYTYKRYTPPGLRFSRKVNYW